MVKNLYQKLFVIFAVLAAVVINVYLALVTTRFSSSAAISTAEFYFEPENANVPPGSSIRLMLNPSSQSITFVRAAIRFEPDSVRLSSVPVVSASQFELISAPTNLADANANGFIEIVLAQRSGTTPPNSTFEVANLNFDSTEGTTSESTSITLVDEDSQVVDTSANDLPFNVRYADLTIGGSTGGRTGSGGGPRSAAAQDVQGSCPENYIDTAIGCIPYSSDQAMAEFFLKWGLGIAGGVALILIVLSGFKIITSSGDPKKLQSGKELLTAAVTGLMLLVFGAYILRFIGVDLLQIPGF